MKFQLSPNKDVSTLPDLPEPKMVNMVLTQNEPEDIGPMLPVPEGIRPTLSKYR